MPELPEVEMICERLHRELFSGTRGWQVSDVSVHRSTKKYLPGNEREDLLGRVMRSVHRRGKYVVFTLDPGVLACHNAMSGYWDLADRPWSFDYVEGKRGPTESDVRVSIGVSPTGLDRPSERTLRFHDSRLFGSLRLYPDAASWRDVPCLGQLGPEALDTERSLEGAWGSAHLLAAKAKHPGWEVKRVLMDQPTVAGIGNIYSCEALWMSRIYPARAIGSLSDGELATVREKVTYQLRSAIERECTYSQLRCYRQSRCSECGVQILRTEVAGRSTYFCPACQA